MSGLPLADSEPREAGARCAWMSLARMRFFYDFIHCTDTGFLNCTSLCFRFDSANEPAEVLESMRASSVHAHGRGRVREEG